MKVLFLSQKIFQKIIDWYKEQKMPQKNIEIEIFNHQIKKMAKPFKKRN